MSASSATVCVATHRRPLGLEKLLRSLAEQQGAPPFNVVIVDNDHEKSAEAVALGFRDRLALTYLVEPIRGIARTRNRAVAVTQSPFLAFIDDDEWAAPDWLAALDRQRELSAADIVIGRVDAEFDADVPAFVRNCGLFDPSPLANGATVPWYMTRTSNAYVRRHALPDSKAPFAMRFDLVGGEDCHLFKTMIDAGARAIACATARVFEHRPLSRANFAWVVRRSIRNGGTDVALSWSTLAYWERLRKGLRVGFAGSSELIKAATRVAWNKDSAEAGRKIVSAGQDVGRLLYVLGMRIEEYRQHP